MSIFKRLSATLVSSIDQVVGEIENHDAVIQANLNDMRKKIAAAKVRLSRVRREEQQLTQQIQTQHNNAAQWRKRAVECGIDDETKALECLQRAHKCQTDAERLSQSRLEYKQTTERLAHDIESGEQRLAELTQKHSLMRARQSTSCAVNAINEPDDVAQQLEESFERWEINITQAEVTVEGYAPADPLEHEFTSREQQEELRIELATLLAEEEQK